MRRLMTLAAALAASFGAAEGSAQSVGQDPFVFVSDRNEDGTRPAPNTFTWYMLPMTIRPTGTIVAGIPIATLNAFHARQLAERPAISVEPWCFANLLSDRSYVSSNRNVQAGIVQSFTRNDEHRFQVRGRFTGAGELTAYVGHFETCLGEIGSFILIAETGTSPPSPVFVDTLPYVSGLQYMRVIEGNITVSTCFECGDVTGLFYDERRRRFYWEALGD